MKTAKILVVDCDTASAFRLKDALEREDMDVVMASSGQQALHLNYEFRPHLAIISDPLSDFSSFELCSMLRQYGKPYIVLLVPGPGDELVLQGYECGADDCVTKPISVAVLTARVQAMLQRGLGVNSRRSEPEGLDQYMDDHLVIDLARRRILVDGQHVHLTPTEYRLLAQLVRCAGDVLTYSEILDLVWNLRERPRPNYVHTYISRLRHKLERDPHSPQYLLSEPRIGYRFR